MATRAAESERHVIAVPVNLAVTFGSGGHHFTPAHPCPGAHQNLTLS